MNWTRYKTLIIGGAISLLLIGVGVFFILNVSGKASAVRSDIDSSLSRRTTLTLSKPYPSKENFEQLKANKVLLEKHLETCESEIRLHQATPLASMGPAGFSDYANREIRAIKRKAPTVKSGGEAGVVLRDQSFGFETYLKGVPPAPQDVSRLTIQLIYMKHLTLLLFEQGISELIDVQREKFEVGSKEKSRQLATFDEFGGENSIFGKPAAKTKGLAPSADTARSRLRELFEGEKFTLRFRAYEREALSVLNALAADKNQIVLTKVEFSNGNRTIWPDYVKASEGISPIKGQKKERSSRTKRPEADLFAGLMGGSGEPMVGEKDGSVDLVGLLEQRKKVTGGELMEVRVDLSIYRLKDEPAAGEDS